MDSLQFPAINDPTKGEGGVAHYCVALIQMSKLSPVLKECSFNNMFDEKLNFKVFNLKLCTELYHTKNGYMTKRLLTLHLAKILLAKWYIHRQVYLKRDIDFFNFLIVH